MTDFRITNERFLINGAEQFLLCGEIHYFRMEPQYWEAALDQLVEAGCNAVAYYVPWFVHEYEEGQFDFDGHIHPSNNLRRWMELTQKKGLIAYFRPGPYIYAESEDLGIPRWFTEKHPNAHTMRREGENYLPSGLKRNAAHNHPDFLAAVERWLTRVCQETVPHQAPQGNVVMVQLCNEIPGEDTDDRNPENLGVGREDGLFPTYLREKYQTIENLNAYYHSDFTTLCQIEPHQLEQANPDLAWTEHLEYYYTFYYPVYFKRLEKIMRENGITVQLTHNAYNPRAVSLHYHTKRQMPQLLIGIDSYYSLSGRLSLKDAAYYCEFGAQYVQNFLHNVPWVIEQESGYWNDYPTVYGKELYLWNIWTFAGGHQGVNLYLFASGENRPGMGCFGTDHNWQAPVNQFGEQSETFADVKASLAACKAHYETFSCANRYDIAFGVKHSPGLIWRDVSRGTAESYYALRCAGFNPGLCDFMAMPQQELNALPALWVVSDSYLSKEIQQKLLAYVQQGGKLIMQGCLPYRDEWERPCTVLADALGLTAYAHKDAKQDQNRLCYRQREYFVGRTIQKLESPAHMVWATEYETGAPAAVHGKKGAGEVLVLPFALEVAFNSQVDYIAQMLRAMEILPYVSGAKKLRVIPKRNGQSVVLNLHPIQVRERLTIGGQACSVELEPLSFQIVSSGGKTDGLVSAL